MVDWKDHKLLIIGLIVVVAAAFLLAEANTRQAACQSIGGQIVQIFDASKKGGCENVMLMQFFAYAGIAIGVALMVANFVKKK
ncbi:MAG: hypothetical protein KKD17_00390 [Nanoarchaeota archaeon]|nr:hypothetical protein [Nanoarchaeota archaeon]